MFDVYGSKHSLLARIWDVDAVGIGARRSELRTPYCLTSFFNFSQSQRPLSGVTPHMSNWKIPLETGDPLKVSYGPSSFDNSMDASMAAKYIVSKISLFSPLASGESKGMRSKIKASARP